MNGVSVCKNTLFEVYEIHPINMTRECVVDPCRDVGSSPVNPGDRAGCFFTFICMFCLQVVMIMLLTVLNMSP